MDEKKVKNIVENITLSEDAKKRIVSGCVNKLSLYDDGFDEHIYTTVERVEKPKRFPKIAACAAACAMLAVGGAAAFGLMRNNDSDELASQDNFSPPTHAAATYTVPNSDFDVPEFTSIIPNFPEIYDSYPRNCTASTNYSRLLNGEKWKTIYDLLINSAYSISAGKKGTTTATPNIHLNANEFIVNFYTGSDNGFDICIASAYESNTSRYNCYYCGDMNIYNKIYGIVHSSDLAENAFIYSCPRLSDLYSRSPVFSYAEYEGKYYSLLKKDITELDAVIDSMIKDNDFKYEGNDEPNLEDYPDRIKISLSGYTLTFCKNNTVFLEKLEGTGHQTLTYTHTNGELYGMLKNIIAKSKPNEKNPIIENMDLFEKDFTVSFRNTYSIYRPLVIGLDENTREKIRFAFNNCTFSEANAMEDQAGDPCYFEIKEGHTVLKLYKSGYVVYSNGSNSCVLKILTNADKLFELLNSLNGEYQNLFTIPPEVTAFFTDHEYLVYVNGREYTVDSATRKRINDFLDSATEILGNANSNKNMPVRYDSYFELRYGNEKLVYRDDNVVAYCINGTIVKKFIFANKFENSDFQALKNYVQYEAKPVGSTDW